MYGIAESLLARHNIPFDILRPLILETARKTELGEPSEIQTGPASRNDQQIIIRHLDLLTDNPELWGIYSLISKNILKQTLKKNGKL